MVKRQYSYINVMWDLVISVVLCIVSGCLAPERARHGSARPALSMDLDEICMFKLHISKLPSLMNGISL